MRPEDEPLVDDTLFLALTRPAMLWGVPLEGAVYIILIGIFGLLATGNPLYGLGLGGGLFFAARLVAKQDYNQFRVLSLWMRTKGLPANGRIWKGSSYGPLASPLLKRKGFANVPES